MFPTDLSDLDAAQALDLADRVDAAADAAETARLRVALRWADLHGALDDAQGGRCLPGAERLIPLGGDGAPGVQEFCPAELGARWKTSHGACAALIGDALDLRHRLPRLWDLVQAGKVRPWAGRRIAQATRDASAAAAAHADRKVALWAHCKSVGQLEQIAQAALIQADPAAAERAARDAEQTQGVWVGQSTDHGIKDVHIRTDAASATWFDASIDRVADGLGVSRGQPPRRGGADANPGPSADRGGHVNWLDLAKRQRSTIAPIHPGRRLSAPVGAAASTTRPGGAGRAAASGNFAPIRQRGLPGTPGCVGGLGRKLTRCDPVPGPGRRNAVDGHQAPEAMREAVLLRSPVNVFPWATGTSRRRDLDHTAPYVPIPDGGQPGQTRTDNLAPMGRRSHRVKSHGRWRVWQIHDGVLLWQAPHGHCYLVDRDGTHPVTRTRAPATHPALN